MGRTLRHRKSEYPCLVSHGREVETRFGPWLSGLSVQELLLSCSAPLQDSTAPGVSFTQDPVLLSYLEPPYGAAVNSNHLSRWLQGQGEGYHRPFLDGSSWAHGGLGRMVVRRAQAKEDAAWMMENGEPPCNCSIAHFGAPLIQY